MTFSDSTVSELNFLLTRSTAKDTFTISLGRKETYVGLIDAEYLQNMTEEKYKVIAPKWTNNILVAKDGDKVIGFVSFMRNMVSILMGR